VAALVAGVAALAVPGPDQPTRIGLSRFDEQLACMSSVLGKPVMTGFEARTGVGRALSTLQCRRSMKPERLREDVRSLKLSMLDAGDWYVLIESSRFEPDSSMNVLGGYRWKQLLIRERFDPAWSNGDPSPPSRKLTPAEMVSVGRQMLRAMRPVSVSLSRELVQEEMYPEFAVASPDGVTTIREVFLALDVQRLDAADPEKVIGLLRTAAHGFQGRLGVGEIRGDRLHLLWDSPVLSALYQRSGYDDMDGDGTREILLLADDPNRQVPYKKYLTVFDEHGNELTRQEECWPAEALWDTREGSACPLVGLTFELVPARSGRGKDVVVVDDAILETPECRYELKDGHYWPEAKCTQR
jgi:hypothetical protein